VDVGGGNDTVRTAVNTDGPITYKGGTGTDTLFISLTAAQAADPAILVAIANLVPGSGVNGSVNVGGLNFSAEGLKTSRLASPLAILSADRPLNVQVGNWDHNQMVATNPAKATALFGLGGDDTIIGGNMDDVLVGGNGMDTMDGGNGSDTYLIGPGESPATYGDAFTDTGSTGYDRIVATGNNTQIVIKALSGIEEINSGALAGLILPARRACTTSSTCRIPSWLESARFRAEAQRRTTPSTPRTTAMRSVDKLTVEATATTRSTSAVRIRESWRHLPTPLVSTAIMAMVPPTTASSPRTTEHDRHRRNLWRHRQCRRDYRKWSFQCDDRWIEQRSQQLGLH
jgi:hypothetical protein